jgi:anti-sigma regulatory factor (Ser/Thr protein kinase)
MPIHHSTELSIPARFAELPGLLAYVEALGQKLGASATESARIQLIIEELVSNSITHGYGGECDRRVTVALHVQPNGLTLIYSDQAPPFDLSRMSASDPVDDQIGGLGINLILGLARSIRYQRSVDRNITEIDL